MDPLFLVDPLDLWLPADPLDRCPPEYRLDQLILVGQLDLCPLAGLLGRCPPADRLDQLAPCSPVGRLIPYLLVGPLGL